MGVKREQYLVRGMTRTGKRGFCSFCLHLDTNRWGPALLPLIALRGSIAGMVTCGLHQATPQKAGLSHTMLKKALPSILAPMVGQTRLFLFVATSQSGFCA
jgi:hypothetical protein